MQQPRDFEEQWDMQEENKRRALNLTTACIFVWISVTLQLMLPKAEARILLLLESRIIAGNIIIIFIVLLFLVYKIETSFAQVLNYAYFYLLFVALQLPHYGIPAEIFIPCWIGSCMFYIIIVVYSESLPFIIYPNRPLPVPMVKPPIAPTKSIAPTGNVPTFLNSNKTD